MSAFTTKLGLRKPGGGSTGLILPDEQADIDVINTNMDTIDGAMGAKVVTSGTRPASPFDGQMIFETDTLKILVWRQSITTWQDQGVYAGAGRGALANYLVATPAALDALTNATLGDTAWMTTPGTGIDPFMWVAAAGAGATIDWRPQETIMAATKANMDTFIGVIAALPDLPFQIGADWFDKTNLLRYLFTTVAGAYKRMTVGVSLIPTIVGTGGVSAVDAQTGEVTFSGAITQLDAYIPTAQLAYLSSAKYLELNIGYVGATVGSHTIQVLTGAGAPDATAGSYTTDLLAVSGGAPSGLSPAASTSWVSFNTANRRRHRLVGKVFNLAVALPTEFQGTFSDSDLGANRLSGTLSMSHDVSSAFTGFRIALAGLGAISNGQLTLTPVY